MDQLVPPHEPHARHGRPPRSPQSVQLFCFPYAGSSAATYVRWRRRSAPWIDVIPVELPGRGRLRAEPLQSSVAGMVERVMRQVQPDASRPFALFGHSLGAVIAFECARRLCHERSRQPILLFASGAAAPSRWQRDGNPAPRSDLELRAELGRLDGTPAAVLSSTELMELALPVLRADFQAAGRYRCPPRTVIGSPIHAIGGAHDDIGEEALATWRDHTEGDFFLSVIPGKHFFIHDSEDELLDLVERSLTRQLSTHRASAAAAATAYDAGRSTETGETHETALEQ